MPGSRGAADAACARHAFRPLIGAGVVAAVPNVEQPPALAHLQSVDSNAAAVVLAAPLVENPFAVYFAGRLLSPKSRRSQLSKLRRVLRLFFRFEGEPRDFPWHTLRYGHIEALRGWMASVWPLANGRIGAAPQTCNGVLTTLRGILRQCYRLELISERDFRLCSEVPNVKGHRVPTGRMVPTGEARAMFEAVRERQAPELAARNAAMLGVLYGGGLRRGELAGLDLANVNAERTGLRFVGKGNKERVVPLPAGAVAALEAWLALRGDAPGPLFYPTAGQGTRLAPGERISEATVYSTVKRIAKIAGVPDLSPHDYRRNYGSTLLDGADIKTVSKLMGHSSMLTTGMYDRRDERAALAASELVFVPFDGAQNPK